MKKTITITAVVVLSIIVTLPFISNKLQARTNSIISKNIEALTTPENIDTAYGYKKLI